MGCKVLAQGCGPTDQARKLLLGHDDATREVAQRDGLKRRWLLFFAAEFFSYATERKAVPPVESAWVCQVRRKGRGT